MSFLLQRYVSNLFISIIIEENTCRLFAKVIKNAKIIKTFETVFEVNEDEKLDPKIITYLQEKKEQYHSMYLAYYLNSLGQGAINTINKDDFKLHNVDVENVTHVDINNSYSIYASNIDINWARSMFEPFELDLLYSPFTLLHVNKQTLSENSGTIVYIYNEQSSFALSIFDEQKLLFSSFFKINSKSTKDISYNHDDDIEDNDIDEIMSEDDEKMYDLDEYKSLDDFEEFDSDNLEENLEDAMEFEDEKLKDSEENEVEDSIISFGRDVSMYNLFVSAIKEFYENSNNNTFLDKVIIFDGANITDSFINMLENELFMNVKIHPVKTLDTMCELACKDVLS